MSLFDKSKSYYEEANIYERFSLCEDSCEQVPLYLSSYVKDKKVLDAGCGTGKFLSKLNTYADITGVDLSHSQLKIAQSKHNILALHDLEKLGFKDNTFDVAYCTWVLGTILDLNKRTRALNELKRIANTIILIENAENSEFEVIRGRHADTRTLDYNNWVLSQGFTKDKVLHTSFEFNTAEEAQYIFAHIWGPDVANRVKSAIIKHTLYAFIYKGV